MSAFRIWKKPLGDVVEFMKWFHCEWSVLKVAGCHWRGAVCCKVYAQLPHPVTWQHSSFVLIKKGLKMLWMSGTEGGSVWWREGSPMPFLPVDVETASQAPRSLRRGRARPSCGQECSLPLPLSPSLSLLSSLSSPHPVPPRLLSLLRTQPSFPFFLSFIWGKN